MQKLADWQETSQKPLKFGSGFAVLAVDHDAPFHVAIRVRKWPVANEP
jgi:hypothetical protein